MNCNDLRIGNYIQDKDNLLGFVININRSTVRIKVDNELEDLLLNYNHVQPILLTEEWLLKFGFKNWGSYKYLWKVNRDTGGKLTVTSKPLFKSIHDCDFEINNNHLVGIKYVHQLQNLYFALVGEELTIKEEVFN